jgi:hypothetical protein
MRDRRANKSRCKACSCVHMITSMIEGINYHIRMVQFLWGRARFCTGVTTAPDDRESDESSRLSARARFRVWSSGSSSPLISSARFSNYIKVLKMLRIAEYRDTYGNLVNVDLKT